MFPYSSAPGKIKLQQSPMITSQILTARRSAVPLKHCNSSGLISTLCLALSSAEAMLEVSTTGGRLRRGSCLFVTGWEDRP